MRLIIQKTAAVFIYGAFTIGPALWQQQVPAALQQPAADHNTAPARQLAADPAPESSRPAANGQDETSAPARTPSSALASDGAIGDVVYSILPPELFAQARRGQWVLADGRDLPSESLLRRFLIERGRADLLQFEGERMSVPDARGVFIRGLNLAREIAQGDPAGADRRMGVQQAEQVGEHEHVISYPANVRRASNGGNDRFNAPWVDNAHGPRETERTPNPENAADTETRPRNIALYVYIKIGD